MSVFNSVISSASISLTNWNHCFLCSSPLPNLDIAKLSKGESRFSLGSDCAILFKYLLHSCSNTHLQNALLHSPQQLSRIRLCSSCDKSAETLKELHLFLEVLQMKIVDNLKSLKARIHSNSRNFGTNAGVKREFVAFELRLMQEEKEGVNCASDRNLLQLISELQTFVHDSRGNEVEIPVVYLDKFLGGKRPPERVPSRITSPGAPAAAPPLPKRPVRATRKPEKLIEITLPIAIATDLKEERELDEEDCTKDLGDFVDDPFDGHAYVDVGEDDDDPDYLSSSDEEAGEEISKEIESGEPPKKKVKFRVKKKKSKWRPKATTTKTKPKTIKSCEMCDFSTRESLFDLRAHLLSHETEEKNHTCSTCERSFTTNQCFKLHVKQHEFQGSSKCDLCQRMILAKNFKEHIEVDHGKEHIFTCELCEQSYGSYSGLIKHLHRHRVCDQERKFRCELCPEEKETFELVPLCRHLLSSHDGYSDILFVCEYPDCSKSYLDRNSYRSHKLKHENKFVCEGCDKSYGNKASLDNHRRQVHGEGTRQIHNCDLCENHFEGKIQLEKHQFNEHGMGFECDKCLKEGSEESGKKYATKGSLKYHRRTAHGTEEVLQCSECPKQFNSRQKMSDHQIVHKTSREFTCETCGFATKSVSLLTQHKTRKHDPSYRTRHKCPECPKTFGKPQQVRAHLRTHTGERPFVCDTCGMSFGQVGSLDKHKRRHLKNKSFVGKGKSTRKGGRRSSEDIGKVEQRQGFGGV